MVKAFLKGVWGKPSQQGTGVVGLWDTGTKKITGLFTGATSLMSIIKFFVIAALGLILYKRFKNG